MGCVCGAASYKKMVFPFNSKVTVLGELYVVQLVERLPRIHEAHVLSPALLTAGMVACSCNLSTRELSGTLRQGATKQEPAS